MRKRNLVGKIFGIALVFAITASLVGGLTALPLSNLRSPSQVLADEVVTFPDPNLEAAIRDAIGKPSGDIYQSDLDGLTSLSASSRSIVSLTGLEHCTSLTWLRLGFNQISDISPVSNLTSLTYLNLWDNQISDISPVSNLTSLTQLWLMDNQISDISPVSNLTSLTRLDLWSNQISDISPVSNLTSLTGLTLRENQISDISPVSSLTSLTQLWLDNNQISDISPVSNLTSLTYLGLGWNQISDISPVSNLTSLTGLALRENQISDISLVSNLTSLTYLYLGWNQISDISPVSNLTSLRELDLGGNQISNISLVSNLTSLTRLKLGWNQISDISPVSNLTSLTYLYLGGNQISDISPVSNLTSLTWLWLGSNQISDISPVSNLTSLTSLDLGSNQISDISPVSNLTSLIYLRLEGNQISDISPVSSLTSLTVLWIRGNQISDIKPLVDNSGLGGGDQVDLRSNPLSAISLNTYIPQLEARGVIVSYDAPLDTTPPANVTDLAISETTASSINLTWHAPGDDGNTGTASEYDIRYSTSEINETNWNLATNCTGEPAPQSAGSSESFTVTGLSPNTTYYLALETADEVSNWSGLSNVVNGTTTAFVVVTFPDPNLEAAIRDAIGKPTGDIYQSDLDNLTSLYAGIRNIIDLTGLEHCTSLTYLGLGDNQISDISPISNLTSLIYLGLWNNQISDISPVSNLTSLTDLDLYSNQISDISPVSNLTSLTYLYLYYNQISDISPVSNLTSLTGLYLYYNQISDISPVSKLTSLTCLNLHHNQISDISPVSNLTSLTWLDLWGNQISNISPVSNLTSLTRLYLWNNQISDISPVSNLTSLTNLRLMGNQISDISPVSSLTSLTRLDLGSNQISDISPVSNLTSLTRLDLGSNQISDISPVSNLTSLTRLWLGSNQISDISPVSNLTSLTWLDLGSNQISDISPVSNLTSLTMLWLWGNQISDIKPLVDNSGLGGGDEVDLRSNPLSATSLNTYIPQLEARGVIVSYDAPPTRTWYVDDDLQDYPSADFTKIQDAVDAASPGDTIIVYPGTYIENVDVNTANLTIKSQNGTANCVVNTANSSDHGFDVTADWVNITGFTVQNATGINKAGIYLNAVSHCNISGNNATNNSFGISLASSNNNVLNNNNAYNNTYGIHLHSSSNNNLTSNTANSNNHGILLDASNSNNTLTNNTATSNNWTGIFLFCSSNNNLTNNTVNWNTLHGIYLWDSSNNTIYNNYFANTNNAYDDNGNNTWNTTKQAGPNIVGGPYLGGNYWSDYSGNDTNGDGFGDTLVPYNSSGNIQNGGDYLPLVPAEGAPAPVWSVGDNWVYNCSYENPGGNTEQDTCELTVTVEGEEAVGDEVCYKCSGIFEPPATRDAADMPLTLHVETADIWTSKDHMEYVKMSSAIAELPGLPSTVTWTYPGDYGWPYEVGETWSASVRVVAGVIDEITELENKVVGVEIITVPAGTFECYHIVTYEPTNPGNYTFEHWFSTVVKSDVKMIDRFLWAGVETRELTSYSGGTPSGRNLPDSVQRGETFDVFVTFTAPEDKFNAIGLTDFAPYGWNVAVDAAWCTPNADAVLATDNKAEILWFGEPGVGFDKGTSFSVLYKVTVPDYASAGIHTFDGSLEYWVGLEGPYLENITGDSEVFVGPGPAPPPSVPVWYVGDTWVYDCSYANPGGKTEQDTCELTVTMEGEEAVGEEACYKCSGVFDPAATRDAADMPLTLHVETADIWNSKAHMEYVKVSSAIAELPGLPSTVTWTLTGDYGWPYEVGKTWSGSVRVVAGVLDEITEMEFKVLGVETINVPAGTFECYHIVTYEPTKPGTYLYEHWFNADAVKSVVKEIDRFLWAGVEVRELVSYSVGTPPAQYNLTISSTSGGSVTTPGEGTFTYNASEVVNLVASAEPDYHFTGWAGDVGTIGNVNSRTTTITMNGDYFITANFAEGAVEVDSEWGKVDTPYREDWTIAPNSDIFVPASIPGGEVIYVVGGGHDNNNLDNDYGPRLWKSEDSGVTWDDIADRVWDADGLPANFNLSMSYFNYVACAQDDSDFVAVAVVDTSAAVSSTDYCNMSQAVVISDDGGDNFYGMGDVSDSASNAAFSCVFDMKMSDEDTPGKRNIAIGGVGTRNGTCPTGLVFSYETGGLIGGRWVDASAYDGWDDDGAIASQAVTRVAFAPSWLADNTVLAVSHTANETYLQSGTWGNCTAWNADAGFEPAVQIIGADQSIWPFSRGAAAGLTLPTDYEGRHASTRYAWVYVDNEVNGTGVIYRVMNGAVVKVAQQISDNPWLTSISYLGDIETGKAIAGLLGDGTGYPTECCEGVQVYRNDGISDMDICCERWSDACKPPTGRMAAKVLYVSPNKAYGFVGDTGAPYEEGAFSFSLDDGDTWNQLGLVDTYVNYLSDVTKSADCSKTWVVSVNTAEGGVCECDSVWLKASWLPEASEYSGAWIREWCEELTYDEVLNSYQTPEVGLLRLAPEETGEALTVYLIDRGTDTVYYDGNEGLGCWEQGSSTVDEISDLAVQDEATIYALDFNGDVAVSDDHGAAASWSSTMDGKVNDGHTIAVLGEGNVLVGGDDGKVSYSDDDLATFLDGDASFTEMDDIGDGYVHVAFDSYFDTNSVIYAAVSNVVVDNMSYETPVNDPDNGIYRWVIGESSKWKDLGECAGTATPTETQLGLGPSCDTVEVGYYGIVLSNADGNPETDAITGGVLYATFYDADGNVTGVARCLNPAEDVACGGQSWDYLIESVADTAAFTLEPSSLKICGCLTPDTNARLWAIDDNWYYDYFATDEEDSDVGRLWTYEDCYAKSGTVLIAPADGAVVSCDPHYWWNDAFALKWERQCDACSYNLQIAYDEDFTGLVLDISGKDSDCQEIDYEPTSGSNPSYLVAEGALGPGSCDTKFYWRVRSADAETGEIIHSPWSEARSFTVAGEPKYYNLTILSTSGGNVTTPGEGTFSYNASEVVSLVATADNGYQFVNWTGDTGTIGDVNSATTNIIMTANYSIVANFAEGAPAPVWFVGDNWVYNCSYENPGGKTEQDTCNLTVTMVGEEPVGEEACYHCAGVFDPAATRDAADMPLTLHIETADMWNSKDYMEYLKTSSAIAELPGLPSVITWDYTGDYGWPYDVGKTWSGSVHVVAGVLDEITEVENKVLGVETVTVPAGTFSCYHIVTYEPAKPGTYLYEHWFNATVVKSDVKMIDRFLWAGVEIRELASYSVQYNLAVNSTSGGNVTTPGEGTFTCNASEVVDLVATADTGYQFVKWSGDTGTIANVDAASTNITMNGDYSITANFVSKSRPRGGGGGGGGGAPCYLDIDMLGNITRVRITCTTSRTLEDKVAPDFNSTHFLEIDYGTTVICPELGEAPEALVMRLAEESPPVPDGLALVTPVYNFTGNYGDNWLKCCSGVAFGQNVTIVLDYDPNKLPESTVSLAVAYYDAEQGRWVNMPPDIGRVAEVGKATGLMNHFSTVAIIAELAPAPASFAASALNIEQSPKVWKSTFVAITGEDVTITANVVNNGGEEGTYIAELKLNGETIDTKEVTLATGQSQQVRFTLSGMRHGQYAVEVAGLNGEFTVSRTINWLSILGIILGVGLITWAVIWGRKRRKTASPA